MRTFTCIVCPNGCEMTCRESGGEIEVEGALCAKGEEYVGQELTDPRRTISSLVKVEGGSRPLVSVRITAPIPRDRIGAAMEAIKAMSRQAPVKAGEALATDFLEPGCDLIAVDDVDVA